MKDFTDDFEGPPKRFLSLFVDERKNFIPKEHTIAKDDWLSVRPGETFPQYNARIKCGQPTQMTTFIPQKDSPPSILASNQHSEKSKRRLKRNNFLKERKIAKKSGRPLKILLKNTNNNIETPTRQNHTAFTKSQNQKIPAKLK